MNDMNLFDRFHAAFDIAPPAGGFERLRRELTSHSAARRRRPAFHLRWNMGLRLVAAVAAVVIAIALLAGYLAGHSGLVGGVPAGSGGSVASYQSLMKANNDAWHNAPFNCVQVTDASCVHDMAVNRAVLVKWRSDLGSINTPAQFVVIDAQIKRHLDSLIRVADIVINAINTRNQAVFDAGNQYATAVTGWLQQVTNGISATHPVTTSQYTGVLHTTYSYFFGSQTYATVCSSLQDALCQHDLNASMEGVGQMQADAAENQAPAAMAAKDLNLQKDLAQADDALMQMGEALVNNDSAALQHASTAYSDAIVAVSSDLQS